MWMQETLHKVYLTKFQSQLSDRAKQLKQTDDIFKQIKSQH